MKYIVTIYFLSVFRFAKCSSEAYISGGAYATYDQYPHSVFLFVNCEYISACGGSILNQNIVLTAAHCTENCNKYGDVEIHIKYGHHDIEEMKTTFMKHYAEHEDYNPRTVMNDIGLMSTTDGIKLDNMVKRVIIMEYPPLMEFGYVAGWGLSENGDLTSVLKHTRAQIQKSEVCEMVFGEMPPGIFCAGPLTGLGTPKEGDSGSALVYDGYIQIGIVSYNMPKYSLVAYTNVSYYLEWITTNSERVFCADQNSSSEINI